MQKAIDNCL